MPLTIPVPQAFEFFVHRVIPELVVPHHRLCTPLVKEHICYSLQRVSNKGLLHGPQAERGKGRETGHKNDSCDFSCRSRAEPGYHLEAGLHPVIKQEP